MVDLLPVWAWVTSQSRTFPVNSTWRCVSHWGSWNAAKSSLSWQLQSTSLCSQTSSRLQQTQLQGFHVREKLGGNIHLYLQIRRGSSRIHPFSHSFILWFNESQVCWESSIYTRPGETHVNTEDCLPALISLQSGWEEKTGMKGKKY
jgi:hypothetical protein